jgi:hypothetical protein
VLPRRSVIGLPVEFALESVEIAMWHEHLKFAGAFNELEKP